MSSSPVVHESLANRVVVGAGALASVADEIERLGSQRALLIWTHSAGPAAARVADALGERVAARFDHPVQHTPVSVTAPVVSEATDAGVDGVVSIGGGSAVGLGKAVAVRLSVPHLAVPTTYAGSEVTPVVGETEGDVKTTRRDPAIAPAVVVYDPELTVSMPAGLTRTSAINALAHAVESLWAPDATAVSDALATESAHVILSSLPEVLAALDSVEARGKLQQGAWLAGLCLAQTQMGLHHQLAHVLGGMFDLPHAELHTMLLAHVAAYNLPEVPAARRRLERVVAGDPVTAIWDLARGFEGPTSLEDLGVPRDRLRAAAERVVAKPYPNPREADVDSLTELLDRVWSGAAPSA